MRVKSRKEMRARRHARVRRKVSGTAERPRMSIMISNRAMQVQFIDDERAVTLAAAGSGTSEPNNVQTAQALGTRAAEAALGKGIARVVVDRGGFRFHGRVKAIVDAALAAGLRTGAEVSESSVEKEDA